MILTVLAGCNGKQTYVRLSRVEELASKNPEEALDSLEAIDYDMLSDADKHYYEFLSVKVPDKAYVKHTSDSLIMKVIDYESRHENTGRYAEALYYGGRVYSDLGDYPNALSYFQRAKESLHRGNTDLEFRVMSQTGRLLTTLRLYDEAIPYITSTLKIAESKKDTLAITHELILSGITHLSMSNFEKARNDFRRAFKISSKYPNLNAKAQMYLGATEYKTGKIKAALNFIRNTPEKTSSVARSCAMGYAANIYLDAGILDTAYMYAKELISDKNDYTSIGYSVLLSQDLKNNIDINTLYTYIDEYRGILEKFYDENQQKLALNQQAFYNYQFHKKKRMEAENSKKVLQSFIIGLIFIILLLVIILLSLKNRNKTNIIKLHKALENIERLEKSLKKEGNIEIITHDDEPIPVTSHETAEELRNRLRSRLHTIYNEQMEKKKSISISPIILETEAYWNLQELVSRKVELKEQDSLWNELEEVVIKSSPNFKKNLQLLVGGKLTSYDLHTAILIKCGISLTQMTILLNRSKGAIVSRRESICYRAFDKKLGTKLIDGIIRLL